MTYKRGEELIVRLLTQVRKETLDIPANERRRMWLWPFLRSYSVVFVGYMVMYFNRKNFNVSQNDLIEVYGYTKTQLGTIGFWFSILYGIGKTAVGYYGDGKNTKNYMCVLLILSSIMMLGFGTFTSSLSAMIVFYAMSGLFQSAGGPSSFATITKWTSRKNRGISLGFWNMSHNVGGAGAALVATFGAEVVFGGDVRGMFLFPAAIGIAVGMIGFFMGSDTPESYGLGKAEEIFEEPQSLEDAQAERDGLTKREAFKKYVLCNPFIWGLCFANVFVYVVRIGIDQWVVIYGKEVLGMTKEIAKSGFSMFEIGALTGTLLWGFSADFTKGRAALSSIVALGLILVLLGVYQHAGSAEVFRWSLFGLGFLIFGPQLLIGVSGVGFVPKSAVSVTDGVKGTFGYLVGDSFAKLGMGMMADNKVVLGMTGWNGVFTAMYIATVLAIVILIYVAFGEERRIRQSQAVGGLQVANALT